MPETTCDVGVCNTVNRESVHPFASSFSAHAPWCSASCMVQDGYENGIVIPDKKSLYFCVKGIKSTNRFTRS